MLRTLRIGQRPANILKWEGIVNDPIGALLAVFIFAYITYQGEQVSVGAIALDVALSSVIAGLIGFGLAYAVTWVFPRGSVRSEEHTSERQSLMRTSYAVFSLKQ